MSQLSEYTTWIQQLPAAEVRQEILALWRKLRRHRGARNGQDLVLTLRSKIRVAQARLDAESNDTLRSQQT